MNQSVEPPSPADANELTKGTATKRENYRFFMKLFFYEGLVVYLPYILIQWIYANTIQITERDIKYVLWLQIIAFLGLVIMDNYAVRSTHIDRNRQKITIVVSFVGAAFLCILLVLIWPGWNNQSIPLVVVYMMGFWTYEMMGWFFIRAEKGTGEKEEKPSWLQSMFIFLICGLFYLFEYYFHGAIFIGLIASFLTYPLFIIKDRVEDEKRLINPRKLTKKYERMTIWNFIIDFAKLVAYILLIVVIIYQGEMVLYPDTSIYGINAWKLNFALLIIFSAFVMFIFQQIQNKFKGMAVVIFVLIVNLIQGLIFPILENNWRWIVIILNSFSYAGIFFFLEQKMNQASNLRSLPGMSYLFIFLIFLAAILLREFENFTRIFEYSRILICLIGLAYIYGYLREDPILNRMLCPSENSNKV